MTTQTTQAAVVQAFHPSTWEVTLAYGVSSRTPELLHRETLSQKQNKPTNNLGEMAQWFKSAHSSYRGPEFGS